MNGNTLIWFLLVATLLAMPVAATAADPTIDDLNLGKHVYGEEWTVEALKGRTVLVYFWDLG